MANITDLSGYKYQSYLELCLVLVEEAYQDMNNGDFDLARAQLRDILEMFDKSDVIVEEIMRSKNIVSFPHREH